MTDLDLRDPLVQLLDEAAAAYRVPADGARRAAELARQNEPAATPRSRRLTRHTALWVAAAAVVAVVAGAVGLGFSGGTPAPSMGASSAIGLPSRTTHLEPRLPARHGALHRASRDALATSGKPQNATVFGPAFADSARIVKTGTVVLQVPARRVSSVITQVEEVVAGLGGYVSASQTEEAGPQPSGTLTLRVPVDRFEVAVARIRPLGHVLDATMNAQDVTGRYVDLGAQISALQVSRQTYLQIESKATTIGQIIAVQQQVNSVDQQLQQLEGQRKLLASQSAMSSLTVLVQTRASVAPPPPRGSGLAKAARTAAGRFVRGFEDIVSASGPVALALLCLVALWLLGRLSWRRLRRQLV
jgi:hypothetical protein